MSDKRIGITWQITDLHGWGVFGLNVCMHLARHGPVKPLILSPAYLSAPTPRINRVLGPYFKEQEDIMRQIDASPGQATINEALLLHSLGNAFAHSPITEKVSGFANVGFVFFENGMLDDKAMARARYYDKIIAGSSWNRDVIQQHGLKSAAFVSQGVDLERFKPRPKIGTFGDRFIIFSGGKLELRKAQDIVLAVFKIFHERHPDTLLLTNWHNAWPVTYSNLALSPYIDTTPTPDANGNCDFRQLTSAMGIPDGAHIDVGAVSNANIPQIVGEADVALFPNRCEGGTNLVAMETMATGIPCILSANTGHLDIITDDNCYALRQQSMTSSDIDPSGIWRDSDIDEILDTLETAYSNRDDATARAARGVEFMQGLSWTDQTQALIKELEEYL